MPFFLEAAILSRMRSPVTSRSNCAKERSTLRVSRPIDVVVLNCWVTDDQFLGAAIAVHLRRVDQRHPERKTCAQRFFLSGFRISPLREICRALAKRRDNCSIAELYGRRRSTS